MKQLYYLITFFVCTVSIHAQKTDHEYHPLIEEGKVWVQEYNNKPCVTMSFIGDTIVYGHKCTKLLWSISQGEETFSSIFTLYEENGRVWFFYDKPLEEFDYSKEHQDLSIPRLLYDFSSGIGDLLTVWKPDARGYQQSCVAKVVEKKDIVIQGQEYHAHILVIPSEGSPFNDTVQSRIIWLEGIGTIYSPISNYYDDSNAYINWLYSCSVNNEVLYSKDGEIFSYVKELISDNTVHVSPIANRQSVTDKCFDLTGRRLAAPPAKGVYIENGKKWVAK